MQFEKPVTPHFSGEPNFVPQFAALFKKVQPEPPKPRLKLLRQLRKWARKSKQTADGAL